MARFKFFLAPLILAATILVACAPPVVTPAPQEPQCTVAPGDFLGQWQLGMTLAEVRAALGTDGERGNTTMPDSYGVFFREKMLFFSFWNLTHTVSAVTVYDSPKNRLCKTVEGVGIGSPATDLERFGRPEWSGPLPGGVTARAYWTLGLFVELHQNTVRAIGVFDN